MAGARILRIREADHRIAAATAVRALPTVVARIADQCLRTNAPPAARPRLMVGSAELMEAIPVAAVAEALAVEGVFHPAEDSAEATSHRVEVVEGTSEVEGTAVAAVAGTVEAADTEVIAKLG
jgi:hypothetical protein